MYNPLIIGFSLWKRTGFQFFSLAPEKTRTDALFPAAKRKGKLYATGGELADSVMKGMWEESKRQAGANISGCQKIIVS